MGGEVPSAGCCVCLVASGTIGAPLTVPLVALCDAWDRGRRAAREGRALAGRLRQAAALLAAPVVVVLGAAAAVALTPVTVPWCAAALLCGLRWP